MAARGFVVSTGALPFDPGEKDPPPSRPLPRARCCATGTLALWLMGIATLIGLTFALPGPVNNSLETNHHLAYARERVSVCTGVLTVDEPAHWSMFPAGCGSPRLCHEGEHFAGVCGNVSVSGHMPNVTYVDFIGNTTFAAGLPPYKPYEEPEPAEDEKAETPHTRTRRARRLSHRINDVVSRNIGLKSAFFARDRNWKLHIKGLTVHSNVAGPTQIEGETFKARFQSWGWGCPSPVLRISSKNGEVRIKWEDFLQAVVPTAQFVKVFDVHGTFVTRVSYASVVARGAATNEE